MVIFQPYQEVRLGTHRASSLRFHLQALVGCILILSFVYLVQVALKAMIVIHRTLREGDPTFREELINYSRNRGHILNLSNFKDDSSPNGVHVWLCGGFHFATLASGKNVFTMF